MKKTILRKLGKMSQWMFGTLLIVCLFSNMIYASEPAEAQNLQDLYVQVYEGRNDLTQLFDAIEKQTDLRFVYPASLNRDVSIAFFSPQDSVSVVELLTGIAAETGLWFRQMNSTIAVNSENVWPDAETEEVIQPNQLQDIEITGSVVDAQTGEPLPGVNVVVLGSEEATGQIIGAQTNTDGDYSIQIPEELNLLVFTYIGYQRLEVDISGRTVVDVQLQEDIQMLDDLVVVGYGVQRRSDVTGSVASVPNDRLVNLPYQNVTQVLQGSVPGVMVQTTSAGAAPNSVLMVRGRNSIAADNSPLVVVDGVPYSGNLRDINMNDIESIEVLKDASAAAIYGARGSNGVVLITTKNGSEGSPVFSYRGNVSTQQYVNLPDLMNGEEFYNFKIERFPESITTSEIEVYESGEWADWLDLGTRRGMTQEHDLSVSGGFDNTSYFLSGNISDISGIVLNDNYRRISGRINVDTQVANWLTIGTRTQYTHGDRSGESPELSGGRGLFRQNPLTTPFDQDGNYTVYPWASDNYFGNPLANTTFENINLYNQFVSNNFVAIEFPFIKNLGYRLNTGVRIRNSEYANYRGRNTREGVLNGGVANMNTARSQNITLENILTHYIDYKSHFFSTTAVLSFEESQYREESIEAINFPNDIIIWHAIEQAGFSVQNTSVNDNYLISQMLRLNYTFDSRYMLTLTGRRDGYSGFGADNKWGLFPSIALGWNFHNENFFPLDGVFSEFKPRLSYGVNGNHAVNPYQSLSRMSDRNMMYGSSPAPGYAPSRLANENLGWETSRTFNLGLDFGLLEDRITGDLNYYKTNTYNLLLERTISSVHGITSILENIGETMNTGVEMSLVSRNLILPDFMWTTSGNISVNRNEIVDLYGDGRDDVSNSWFIGQPINVNYDYEVVGVWQLDEAEEAAAWNSQPGFVKLKDVNGDGQLGPNDRQIIGQQDPSFMWGMNNAFNIRNFEINVFIHGVHGVTRYNTWLSDDVWADVRLNTIRKNWWTEDNPTNDWIKNHLVADYMAGIQANWYENASFIRIKDVTVSYDLPQNVLDNLGINRFRVYVTGTNLHTFTEWSGLDPELDGYASYPLQREFVLGFNLGF